MNEYKLYRGISVSPEAADAVIGRILEDGITGSEGKRTATLGDLQEARGTIEMSFKERKFDYRNYLDDESNDKAIYAAGTRYGASYYACKHNAPKKEESEALVIEFTVSEDDLAVDLNDFLCTTFQMARSTPEAIRPEQEQCLRSVFGDDILRYFRASCESEDTETQVALAYLAAIDTNIIRAHYKNTQLIRGRHWTEYHSAFVVRAPIDAQSIVDVQRAAFEPSSDVGISLNNFLGY